MNFVILGQTVTGPNQVLADALFEDSLVDTFAMSIVVGMFQVVGQRCLA